MLLHVWDTTLGTWVPFTGFNFKFGADVEIIGGEVNVESFAVSSTGGVTIINCGASNYLHIRRVTVLPTTNLSNPITVVLGATTLTAPPLPRAGGIYGFNASPEYKRGAQGNDLVVTIPTTDLVHVEVVWTEETQ